MTTTPIVRPSAGPAVTPPRHERSGPLRQSAIFVGMIFLIVVATALALPHAPGDLTPLLAMQTPLFVVLLITAFGTSRGKRRALWTGLGLHRLGLRSWPVAFALSVLVIFVLPYAVAVGLGSAGLARFDSSVSFWLDAVANLGTKLVLLTILVLGEEIGWRGYLLPRVQALVSRRWAALIVGFIQGLFHLPLILLTTTYDQVGSRWVVAPMVVATLTFAGVVFAWLRDRSNSVWPVAFAHATINTFIDGAGFIVALAPVTLTYTAGESGMATLLVAAALAAVLLRRGFGTRVAR